MNNKDKCIKCNKEATFDSPELFCDIHWARWFTSGGKLSPNEREKWFKEVLSGINSNQSS